MAKLIWIISVLILALALGGNLEQEIEKLYKDFDAKEIVTNLISDETATKKMSHECVSVLQNYTNHFEEYSDKIAYMVLYSGRDLNDLGRYINCNSLNFTRYISLSVKGLPIGIYLGICGPIECKQEDYYPLKSQLVKLAKYVDNFIPDVGMLKVDWTEDNFQFVDSKAKNSENTQVTTGFIIAVSFFGFFILCCILGTIFEFRLEAIKKKLLARNESVNSTGDNSKENEEPAVVDVQPRGALQKFLYSFAVFNNTRRLLLGRGDNTDKELEILNGIRVFAIIFVVLGHTMNYSLRGPVSNPAEFLVWIQDLSFTIMLAAPYVVDIFFWLSGFLGGYLMLELMKKRKGRNQPYLFIMLHRFLRITPLYFATILFFWFIMSMAGNGPVFYIYKDDYAGAWDKYWWSHILFINNFYPFHVDEQCLGWSWYLPNDMQFFLILPLIVWLLYKYRIVGVIFTGVLMISSFIVCFTILYIEDYSPSYIALREDYYRVFYMKPYMRIAPFLQGIYLGFLLYWYRNDEAEYSIYKRFWDKVKNSWILRQICYWIGLAIIVVITLTFYDINKNPKDYSRGFNALYMTLIRAWFIFGLMMFIFPILLGRGKILREIMGHDWLTPIARISFGMYLIHPTYMLFESFNRQRASWASHNSTIIMFFGWLSVTILTSFLFTIIIETPWANLEKTFLMGGGRGNKKQPKEKYIKVPAESFENSYSKAFVPKTDDDSHSPSKNSKNDDFWAEEKSGNGTGDFKKLKINN